MKFVIYDVMLLILFGIFISIFLYTQRKNLKKEGLLFLYRTKWGIKLIDYVGNKYQKTLKVLSYISIGLGYILMIGIFYLIYTILKIYIFRPDIVSTIKVPPIMPLIPYIDKFVPGLPSFFFTYWIVILAIIAITHEFAHGIFAVYNKVKIKTTGFGFFPFFLPVFLAAFVELDEDKMVKKSKFSQMAILSAGTFANFLTAILFIGILWIFFSLAFAPSGIIFDGYQVSSVGIANISMINGVLVNNPSYEEISNLINETGLTKVETIEKNYLGTKDLIEDSTNKALFEQGGQIILYDDAPAINYGLAGAITEINGIKINSIEKLEEEFLKYSPGEEIKIETTEGIYEIVLGENPQNKDLPWLGIGFVNQKKSGIILSISSLLSLRESNVYYKPKFNGAGEFIYNLLWWIILISISVALINMLPVGIFDGGRFFYLTILAITKSEKKAKKLFKFSTYFFLFILLLLMILWVLSFR